MEKGRKSEPQRVKVTDHLGYAISTLRIRPRSGQGTYFGIVTQLKEARSPAP